MCASQDDEGIFKDENCYVPVMHFMDMYTYPYYMYACVHVHMYKVILLITMHSTT